MTLAILFLLFSLSWLKLTLSCDINTEIVMRYKLPSFCHINLHCQCIHIGIVIRYTLAMYLYTHWQIHNTYVDIIWTHMWTLSWNTQRHCYFYTHWHCQDINIIIIITYISFINIIMTYKLSLLRHLYKHCHNIQIEFVKTFI